MYETKAQLSSSVKTVKENAGFTTPFGKSSLTSRKTVFPVRAKIAFGDLKNMNTSRRSTPSKLTHSSKVKLDDFNSVESANKIIEFSRKGNNPIELDEFTNQIIEEDLMDAWNNKLILTDKQFELLFLNPNENTAPPTPPTTPVDLDFSSYSEIPSHESNFDEESDNHDEFPSLNLSYVDDSWNEKSTKENDQNITNFF